MIRRWLVKRYLCIKLACLDYNRRYVGYSLRKSGSFCYLQLSLSNGRKWTLYYILKFDRNEYQNFLNFLPGPTKAQIINGQLYLSIHDYLRKNVQKWEISYVGRKRAGVILEVK